MTEQKAFSPKTYSRTSLNTSRNRLSNPFSRTVMISFNISDENIKYWKINSKNIWLRLKILINYDFPLNGFQNLA